MALSDIRVSAEAGTRTVIVVDGSDISDRVQAARIDMPPGGVATLWVETLSGKLDFEGQAVVMVPVGEDNPAEWLSRIDAQLLDDAVNLRLQIDPKSYSELVLDVLRDWAGDGD